MEDKKIELSFCMSMLSPPKKYRMRKVYAKIPRCDTNMNKYIKTQKFESTYYSALFEHPIILTVRHIKSIKTSSEAFRKGEYRYSSTTILYPTHRTEIFASIGLVRLTLHLTLWKLALNNTYPKPP